MKTKKTTLKIRLQYLSDFMKSKDSWYCFIIIIPISFLACSHLLHGFSPINLIEYSNDSYSLVEKLIDARIINIATLFSIAFIIIGFSLNKINYYHPVILSFVLKKTLVYVSTYFSLTLIGTLIIISSIRNFLNETTFINMYYYGTFLIIFMLLFVGSMFVKVISLMDFNTLLNHLKNDILKISNYLDQNYKTDKNKENLNEIKKSLEENVISCAEKNRTSELENILNLYHSLYFKEK